MNGTHNRIRHPQAVDVEFGQVPFHSLGGVLKQRSVLRKFHQIHRIGAAQVGDAFFNRKLMTGLGFFQCADISQGFVDHAVDLHPGKRVAVHD